jgi:hypothetical protein
MKAARDPIQTTQRVKVGLIGLAAVVLLIAIASMIIGSATRERPIDAAGSAKADVVANMAATNSSAAGSEPLAELAVAPSAGNQIATK